MSPSTRPPHHRVHSASGVGMFDTAMGKLQRQLRRGEYYLLKNTPLFESDFIEITKKGEVVDVHHRVGMVTVGIASTSPGLPSPDVMLLARPDTGCEEDSDRGQTTKGKGRKAWGTLELTRLLPLKFVRISIHDREKQQLRLKFATGRSCYLQLSPALDAREDLFPYWEKLVHLLRPPVDSHSSTYAIPAEDKLGMPLCEQQDGWYPAGADFQGEGHQDQVSVRSLHVDSEVAGATSAAFAGGEEIFQDPPTPNSLSTLAAPTTKATGLYRESAAGARTEAGAAGEAAVAAAVAAAGTAAELAAGEARLRLPFAGTGAAGKPAGDAAADGSEGQLLSDASSSAGSGEPAGRPLRRERRERKERREERASRSSGHRRAAESRHKAPGNNITPKASSRSLGGHTAAPEDKKDEGLRSPARRRRAPDDAVSPAPDDATSHAPIAEEAGTSHKSGRSLPAGSWASGTKTLGRIRGFLRNLRARLTA
ncbi:protein FAM71A-like [Meles meles]|uniref:protein FAM71A-like n=1 Tax=Meles meles TaxID=9662 RepID=UPI001E69C174|nr:protein FAM71A-like [Meles meles]XP_045852920.1 protein FAM71A-like [Meles meles]